MNWYLDVIKNKYAKFDGRARRQEYWMFVLFNFIAIVIVSLIDALLGLGFLGLIYMLAVLVPSIAVAIRRLHDIGKPGWWILIGFVPIVGLVLIYFLVLDSAAGDNEYGPNPKGA